MIGGCSEDASKMMDGRFGAGVGRWRGRRGGWNGGRSGG